MLSMKAATSVFSGINTVIYLQRREGPDQRTCQPSPEPGAPDPLPHIPPAAHLPQERNETLCVQVPCQQRLRQITRRLVSVQFSHADRARPYLLGSRLGSAQGPFLM